MPYANPVIGTCRFLQLLDVLGSSEVRTFKGWGHFLHGSHSLEEPQLWLAVVSHLSRFFSTEPYKFFQGPQNIGDVGKKYITPSTLVSYVRITFNKRCGLVLVFF